MDTVVNGTWQLAVHSRTFLGSPVTTSGGDCLLRPFPVGVAAPGEEE